MENLIKKKYINDEMGRGDQKHLFLDAIDESEVKSIGEYGKNSLVVIGSIVTDLWLNFALNWLFLCILL